METENERKKAYLRQYMECERREKEILQEIQRLRADQMFPSAVNDGMPKGSQQSDLSDYIVLIEEQIERLKQERLRRLQVRDRIDLAICRMENPDEQRVLRLRYLRGMSWEKLAREMNYNTKHAMKIHARALENFEICDQMRPIPVV